MGLIEKAARRLEELQKTGVELERRPEPRPAAPPPARPAADVLAPSQPAADAPSADADSAALPLLGRLHAAPARRSGVAAPRAGAASPFIGESPLRKSREVEIDLAALAGTGCLTPDLLRSKLSDEFRVLKRPLLANAKGQGAAPVRRGNLIMVTSSLPSEGKTFVSVNLAMSIAMELDSTVLLVDADVSRPAVLERLSLPPAPGLLDVLVDPQRDLADVLLRTNIERLSILPAGTRHPRAAELIASESMRKLLDDLAARYTDRVVVFDAPPLLVSTESRALVAQVGQVVLVVEADRTGQAAIKQSATILSDAPVVMTVLNKVEGADQGGHYGQYGYYGE